MFLTNGEVMKKQDKIDWNFHINFSPLYFVIVFSILMAISFSAKAEEIEEVVVVGQQVQDVKADPLKNTSLIRVLLPAHTWTAGGQGAFQGYNERGAQTVHTKVFKNGLPANLPGSAWYDFGTDLATGQEIKVISGANSVVYGSGSIAGTVLIKDVIESGVTTALGTQNHKMFTIAPSDWIQFSKLDINQDSARNDNTEKVVEAGFVNKGIFS